VIYKLALIPVVFIAFYSPLVQAQKTPNYQQIDALHYTFHLDINDENDQIKGTTELLFKVRVAGLETTYLDLVQSNAEGKGMQVQSVTMNNQPLKYEHTQNRLQIKFNEALEQGYTATLQVQYQGIPDDGLIISENEYGERTFFGDNWPNRAHHWLACVDHPGDKATCEFIVKAPYHYKVIANGRIREESLLRQANGNYQKLTHWAMAQPIPTKVMVFGAAAFAVLHEPPVENIDIQHWVYADNRESSFDDFSPTANILKYLINQVGDYPYEKLVNVESKTKYGGMENASNIFYNEKAVDGNQKIESLIAHEIAHQWFGNSVTEKDWPHVWISEGFATYLAHTYLEFTYGTDTLNSMLRNDKDRIFAYYQKEPQATVVDTSMSNLYLYLNAYSYQKGAWFLHMLRQKMGEDNFWKGIRAFYKRYCHAKADTDDFRQIMESVSESTLEAFFDLWLYQPGHPILKGNWKYVGLGKKLKIKLEQVQENGQTYQIPLEVGVWYEGQDDPEIFTLSIQEADEQFSLSLKDKPVNVMLDPHSKILVDTHLFSD
jgi:aminopeptidase N